MRGQKALWMGCEWCGTENFLFTYRLPSGSSLKENGVYWEEEVRAVRQQT